jgi:hypothetical protein
MAVQPHLFPDSPTALSGSTPGAADAAASAPIGPSQPQPNPVVPAPIWLQRLSLFILVLFCVYLGVIVTLLPWWTSVWDHNLFLTSHTRLWAVLRTGTARGIVSGLGLLDIWIGISEAIHYHDQRVR